jgi:tellurium resistance protein TerD
MAISLSKGRNLNLSKTDPSLRHLRLGLGWNASSGTGVDFDLDASVFMLTEQGCVRSDEDFIFYGQLHSACGGVEHTGDNRTGVGDGDDEMLNIQLDKIPLEIIRLVVAVSIHEADVRQQNFGKVDEAFIRLVNLDTGTELARFDLTEGYSNQTALIFGELYRAGSDWKFKAVGQGYAGGLHALALLHGVDVQ